MGYKKVHEKKEVIEFQFVDELFLFRKKPFHYAVGHATRVVLGIWELHIYMPTCCYLANEYYLYFAH